MGGMRRIGAVAVAALLGLAACGGGDDGEATGDTDATTTTAGAGGDASDFLGECAEFSEAFVGAGAAVGSAFSGAASDGLDDAAAYFEQVAARVPKEIRADFEVFAEAYGDFAKAIAEADIDFSDPSSIDPAKLAELESVSEAFSSAEVEEASANIEAYFKANC